MQKIDLNSCGILFIVDENERLIGCVTDGDIRRFLLAGGKMAGSVRDATNKSPKIARSEEEAKTLFHKKNYIVNHIWDLLQI